MDNARQTIRIEDTEFKRDAIFRAMGYYDKVDRQELIDAFKQYTGQRPTQRSPLMAVAVVVSVALLTYFIS